MLHQLAADAVLGLHFGFLLFVVLGGLLVLRRPRIAWLHLPALVWGTVVSLMGWVCPLTPLENYFRRLAGESGFSASFLEQYVTPIIYPDGLTREIQLIAGVSLPLWNLSVYGLVLWRLRQRAKHEDRTS